MKNHFLFFLFCFLIIFGCKENNNRELLQQTFDIVEKSHPNTGLKVLNNCQCTLTRRDGEVVDTVIKKISFSELDEIVVLIRNSDSTFLSNYRFHDGIGIEIIYLSPLPPPNPLITKKLYEELESYNGGFGLSHKNKEELETVVNNIKKIAKNCGASVVTQN